MKIKKSLTAVMLATGICFTPFTMQNCIQYTGNITAYAESFSDMPEDFQYAVD